MMLIADLRRKFIRKEIDGPYSWMVVLCCGYCIGIAMGIMKSQGVLYLATMQAFELTREQVSWPYTISLVLFFFIGPISGVLSSTYGLRTILLVGSALCSAGLVMSFFCHELVCFSVSYGGLTGIGMGMIFVTAPPLVNHHFKKYRSLAMGVATSGSSVGAMVLPAISEHLLCHYGFHGTFLLLSGFAMNAFVAGTVVKLPPIPTKEICRNIEDKSVDVHRSNKGALNVHSETELLSSDLKVEYIHCPANSQAQIRPSTVGTSDANIKPELKSSGWSSDNNRSIFSEIRLSLQIIKIPVFYVFCVNACSIFVTMFFYSTVIIDFSMDKGIDQFDAKYLLMGYSLTELIAKITTIWITDKGIISRRWYLIVSTLISTVAIACQPLATCFRDLMVLSVVFGLSQSGTTTMALVLVADYLGQRRNSLTQGHMLFMCIPVPLVLPSLIGYFRDRTGSYDGVFYIVAGLTVFCAILWIIEPLIAKAPRTARRQNDPNVNER